MCAPPLVKIEREVSLLYRIVTHPLVVPFPSHWYQSYSASSSDMNVAPDIIMLLLFCSADHLRMSLSRPRLLSSPLGCSMYWSFHRARFPHPPLIPLPPRYTVYTPLHQHTTPPWMLDLISAHHVPCSIFNVPYMYTV